MRIPASSNLAKVRSHRRGYPHRPAPLGQPASTHPVLDLQQKIGNQTVRRLIERKLKTGQDGHSSVQRYADCTPARLSGLDCPPRQKGERETARGGQMVFLPQLDMGTGEKGVLIANFDIDSAGIKANLKETIYWKQFLRIAAKNKSKWRIEGFSDCQGKEKRNGSLRERRAKAVLGLLPTGLKGSITETAGASPGECITDNSTAPDRTLNRSVAIFLVESSYNFKGDTIKGKVETKEPDTSGCTDDQRKRLAVAFPLAKRLGENAMSAISRMTRGSPEEALLKKFFGSKAYEERWHIKQKYAAAIKTIKIGPTYKCVKTGTDPCKSGTVGYVGAHAIITGNPTIVCENAFADDNIELADTILHEATHLGAWTNDLEYCFRSTGCSLDTTDEFLPGIGLSDRGALNNADSYGRFASELFRQ